MPFILDPGRKASRFRGTEAPADLRSISASYTYPGGLDLRPGFPLHEAISERLFTIMHESSQHMAKRHGYWKERDKVLKAFAHLPASGSRPSDKNEDGTYPRIIMPVSYAVLETLMTYMMTAFLQTPVFRYEGVGPEDVLPAALLTEVVQRHVHRNGIGLNLYTAWRDMFAYGIGAGHPRWEMEWGRRVGTRPVGRVLDANTFLQEGEERSIGPYEVLFEGNVLDNIDPYRLLLDPGVSAQDVQKGNFVGWWDRRTLQHLLREEARSGSPFFNVEYLRHIDGTSGLIKSQEGRGNDRTRSVITSNDPVDMFWVYIDVIPNEWPDPLNGHRLGTSKLPEKWLFCLTADKVLVRANESDLVHGKFPVVIGCPDFDGYSSTPTARLEIIDEVQKYIDFLYSSHQANIQTILNDSIVFDPSLINEEDLNDPRPGKRIRYRKKAFGRTGVKDSIFQLKIEDTTANNLNETAFLTQMAHDVMATADPVRGAFAPRTTRISASEVQGVRGSVLSRLEKPALLISMQFMLPLARMFADHTKQFMSQDVYVKSVGELEEALRADFGIEADRGRLGISPFHVMSTAYDVGAYDAIVPGSEDPQAWIDLFTVISQNPGVAAQFDLFRIFRHIARNMGAKNVDQFVQRAQVVPDEVALAQAQAGNALPIENGQIRAVGPVGG